MHGNVHKRNVWRTFRAYWKQRINSNSNGMYNKVMKSQTSTSRTSVARAMAHEGKTEGKAEGEAEGGAPRGPRRSGDVRC